MELQKYQEYEFNDTLKCGTNHSDPSKSWDLLFSRRGDFHLKISFLVFINNLGMQYP